MNIMARFIFIFLHCLLPFNVFAEVSLHGNVTNISGAPVPNAQVTVVSGYLVRHISHTNTDGEYMITLPESPVTVQEEAPRIFSLLQNYPNPFNPGTVIPYTLSQASQVELTIYSILGQKVRTLVSEYQSPGMHRPHWTGCDENGCNVAAGVYLYTLSAGGSLQARKMLLLDGHTGSGMPDMAPVQKTAKPSAVQAENQPYTVIVKAPGYLIYDEPVLIGDSKHQLDITLTETQDAGTYTVLDPVEEWYWPDIRSYPGGFGMTVLTLEPSEDFEGTVTLSLDAKSDYNVRLTSHVLDAEHPRAECTLSPDVNIVVPDSLFSIEDSVSVFSHHSGITDSLILKIDITHPEFRIYDEPIETIIDPFVEWVSSHYPQHSMFDQMDWIVYDYCPGCTGGQGAYINDSFEIRSNWGLGLDYYYFRIRPRDQWDIIFDARKGIHGFEEISAEDAWPKRQ